jgi:hypothetical protein
VHIFPTPNRVGISPILKPLIEFTHHRFGRVRIEFHPDGLPVRHAITHGGRAAAGAFPSSKMGRAMPWQTFGERALIHHLECEYQCKGYLVQPHLMRWQCGGIPHVYFPDAIAEYDRLVVLESKKEHPAARGDDHASKYRMAGEIYRSIGWDFEIVTSAKLTANPAKLLNYRKLIRNQFVEFELAHELTVREHMIASGGVMLFRALAEHVARAFTITIEAAEAIVLAMAVRRILRFNLETCISPVSPVQLVTSRPAAMTQLNFWEKANG